MESDAGTDAKAVGLRRSNSLKRLLKLPIFNTGERAPPPSRVEKLRNRYETLAENDERTAQVPPSREPIGGRVGAGDVAATDTNGADSGGKKGIPIGRSESLRTRREERPSFRKRSDPNIPRSNSDVDADDHLVSGLNQSGSSSNSSLSAKSLDSPSVSLEAVHKPNEVSPLASGAPTIGTGNAQPSPIQRRDDNDDSDFDAEADPPNWAETVDWDIIRHLKPKEKKRQEVINELFHTERTHVRNLKVLLRVFHRPLMLEQILPPDQFKLLFANLEEMIEIHGKLNQSMKAKRKKNPIVDTVGDILLQMFDGPPGESFREAAATFCKNQSIALESLKNRQKKDQKLAQFLADSESNALCRRLQLKDIIPTGMQRLTKYPLLLENLAKYTSASTDEYNNIMRALDCSKEILNFVNQAVKEAENHHRLQELHKKIDRSPFDKVDNPISNEYKNIDLTKYKMHHEGMLIWRITRQKSVELHVLLLESIMVLLQKQDDKYVLRFSNGVVMSGKEEAKVTYSPIIKVANIVPRQVATDKKALFLVSTLPTDPFIYHLVAQSLTDREMWFRHITEAVEAYKGRDGKTKVPGQHPPPVPEPEEPIDDTNNAEGKSRNLENQDATELVETSDGGEPVDGGEGSDTSGSAVGDAVLPPLGQENKLCVNSSDENENLGVSPTASIASGGSVGSFGVPSTPGITGGSSPSAARRFQRVEILQIAEGPPLIEPSEVVVSEGAIFQTAEPVLTPIEKLRRKDHVISQAIEDKLGLVADILHVPRNELERVDDIVNDCSGERGAKDLVRAAIVQATRLSELISNNLVISEGDAVSANTEAAPATGQLQTAPKLKKFERIPSVPISKLVDISSALNIHLTQLLALVTEREEERERLRQELRASREQIHLLHESRRRTPVPQSPSNSVPHSRPNSFISVGSSTSEPCDAVEDDFGFRDNNLRVSFTSDCGPKPMVEAYNPAVAVSFLQGGHPIDEQSDTGEDVAVDLFVDAHSDTSTEFVAPVGGDTETLGEHAQSLQSLANLESSENTVLRLAESETQSSRVECEEQISEESSTFEISSDVH